ncbi:MAG TPA: M48 family metalloprotease [Planctomycetota bacterium]|nr:M48 family metalloprotease [Planctomycetota bacterium]
MFNAWSIGLARSRPKLVATTAFLDEFPDEEIRATMAHELAHARCSHPLKQLLVLELLLAAAATVAIALSGAWPGFEIPVALILFVAFGMPGVTWVMRRAEFTADSMAAQETGCAEALGAALQRLESKNPKPKAASGWMSALYRTHPRTDERLQRLRLLETPAP